MQIDEQIMRNGVIEIMQEIHILKNTKYPFCSHSEKSTLFFIGDEKYYVDDISSLEDYIRRDMSFLTSDLLQEERDVFDEPMDFISTPKPLQTPGFLPQLFIPDTSEQRTNYLFEILVPLKFFKNGTLKDLFRGEKNNLCEMFSNLKKTYITELASNPTSESVIYFIRVSLFLFLQLYAGLFSLHTQGIFHKDIKPENIFIDDDGFVIIGDFGSSVCLRNGPNERDYLPYESNCIYNNEHHHVVDENIILPHAQHKRPKQTRKFPCFHENTKNVSGTRKYMSPQTSSGLCETYVGDIWALCYLTLECLLNRFYYSESAFENIPKTQILLVNILTAMQNFMNTYDAYDYSSFATTPEKYYELFLLLFSDGPKNINETLKPFNRVGFLQLFSEIQNIQHSQILQEDLREHFRRLLFDVCNFDAEIHLLTIENLQRYVSVARGGKYKSKKYIRKKYKKFIKKSFSK